VTSSLNELVVIELAAGGGLLLVLALGSWLILRRGLRPLERMATSARTIAAGDLSLRVEPADGKTEVGQLGLALNTMLTEIEAAFREREATERKLRQFLADASHELRTPLTSIRGFSELFRLGADQDRVQLEVILRRIEEETARMKTLVEDLLLLARLDETRPVEREPVDLAVLAADACSDAIAVDAGRPMELDAPEPVVIAGDQDHLRQAIANLVNNALRHTPAGSPVEVGARLDGGAALVTVRDHGPGLDGDALAHVFDRFWQADAARVGAGAGLGLSIVAGIAAEHGGVARAANHPDGGAVFTLELPIDAAATTGAPEPDPEPAPAPS
jgi:two-component system OmpR family sensor kinase